MANEEQLSILKQGAEVWNKWRAKNSNVFIELSEANLFMAWLNKVDLSRAGLEGANLRAANLRGANFHQANLRRADLWGANLSQAILTEADLSDANLGEAHLDDANLYDAVLTRTNIGKAFLAGVNFSRALVNKSNFSFARMGMKIFGSSDPCIFGDVDFSEAIGLENVVHDGPSRISTDTFVRSKGKIPEVFLRGCGLSDWEIEVVKLYNPDLSNEEINNIQYNMYDLRATQALQISPLFISYSQVNSEFVNKLGDYLTEKGIRYWRDTHEMKAGRLEKQIDRAIRQNPTVLLVLSDSSLGSDWVEHEVREARKLEKEMRRDVLCPVALDDSWNRESHLWPQRFMEQIKEYNILDFSEWQDDRKFEGMFRKLIDGLELFYKG